MKSVVYSLFLMLFCSSISVRFIKSDELKSVYCYLDNDTTIMLGIKKNDTYYLQMNIDKYFVKPGSYGDIEYINKEEFILTPKQCDFDRVPYTLERGDYFSNDSITVITGTYLIQGECYLLYNDQKVSVDPYIDTLTIPYDNILTLKIEAELIKECDGKIYSPVEYVSTDTITIYPKKNEFVYIDTNILIDPALTLNIPSQRIVIKNGNIDLSIHGRLITLRPCRTTFKSTPFF